MQIETIYFPIKTLGFGNRLGIWMVGCPHQCFNCSNPELQPADRFKEISVEQLFEVILTIDKPIDGITITGGDPFLQHHELAKLISKLIEKGYDDILVYSGYTMKELQKMNLPTVNFILENIAVLIDGKYIEALNDNLSLRGSSNQRIIILKEKYKSRYEKLLNHERKLQNVFIGNNLLTFGIPPKNFKWKLHHYGLDKGLIIPE